MEKPNALISFEEIYSQLAGRDLVLFSDFDGTLSDFAPTPEAAHLSKDMLAALGPFVAKDCFVVISGRGIPDLKSKFPFSPTMLSGSHGMEIEMYGETWSYDPGLVETMAQCRAELKIATAEIDGVDVEDQRFAVGVHVRHVAESEHKRVFDVCAKIAERFPNFGIMRGHLVFIVKSQSPWDKGNAVERILSKRGQENAFPIYLGDDTNDEPAFTFLRDRGVGVRVAREPRTSDARYHLDSVDEAREFLVKLAQKAFP